MEPDRCEEERQLALRRERRRRVHAKYRASEKGQATIARYRASEKGQEVLKAAAARERLTAKAKARKRKHLLAPYGITEPQYEEMLRRQNGVCAICGRPPKTRRLAVEHDHHSGRVRGLACHRCNKYKIGTNTVETARKVLAYLESDFDGRKLVA